MKASTLKCMNEMVEWANQGNEVIPMFFQPSNGRAAVSSAVRCAKARGLLVQGGLDGCGNPFYVAPAPVIPEATHAAPATIQ